MRYDLSMVHILSFFVKLANIQTHTTYKRYAYISALLCLVCVRRCCVSPPDETSVGPKKFAERTLECTHRPPAHQLKSHSICQQHPRDVLVGIHSAARDLPERSRRLCCCCETTRVGQGLLRRCGHHCLLCPVTKHQFSFLSYQGCRVLGLTNFVSISIFLELIWGLRFNIVHVT